MSSESEDDFQSADEGSDLEELGCRSKDSVHSQLQSVYAAPCEKVHTTEQDEVVQSEAKKEEIKSKTKKEETQSKARKEEIKSKTKKEETQSKTKEETLSKAKKEETQSKAKKEEIKSKTKKEETQSKAKKEETLSKTKKEETQSKAKKEETQSKARKEETQSKARKEETQSKAKKEELDKNTLDVEVADNTSKNSDDTTERTETIKEFEESQPIDMLCISSENESVSVSQPCIEGEKSVEQRSVCQVNACSEDSITEEVCVRNYSDVDELQKEIISKPESNKDDKSLSERLISDVQNDEVPPKDVSEDAEEKSADTLCKLEVSSQTSSSENSKTENTSDEIEVLAANSNPKLIKKSKIGMKKPREKLGERLGARKLGAKVVSISKDSISSSHTMKCNEEIENMSKNESGSHLNAKNVVEKRGEEEEKVKKRQQWEEQQERWHQALNLDKHKKEDSSGDGDGWSASWGSWGDTFLSAASTFTREVGRGVGTVMETVESSIGAPSPEVMAQEVCKPEPHKTVSEETTTPQDAGETKEAEIKNQDSSDKGSADGGRSGQQVKASYGGVGGFSLGSLVSGVSGALETASSKVLMGGLDTLEVIGRKAMDVIQEGDPGLRKKRAFLSNKNPNLAQVLQEARQRAAEEEKDGVMGGGNNKNLLKPSFEQAWEATEGPVHLEALSLVAKQCQSKKASMAATLPHYIQDKLYRENNVIQTTCELDELEQLEEGLEEVVSSILVKMSLPLQPQKLIEAWLSVQEKAAFIQEVGFEGSHEAEDVLYGPMAQLVAQLCALAHKGGELALITPETNPLDLASHFKELAQAVSCGLENVADQVCGTITSERSAADAQVSNIITNIYLQAAGGNNYIQESLMLLGSVLQYSNTKAAAAEH